MIRVPPPKPTTVYILQCEDRKYYVGKSDDPMKRFEEHKAGTGAAWTKLHPPIDIYKLYPESGPFEEDKITKEMMGKYGIDSVRGGSYVTVELSAAARAALQKELWAAKDCCIRCGREGHFVGDCWAGTDVNGKSLRGAFWKR